MRRLVDFFQSTFSFPLFPSNDVFKYLLAFLLKAFEPFFRGRVSELSSSVQPLSNLVNMDFVVTFEQI